MFHSLEPRDGRSGAESGTVNTGMGYICDLWWFNSAITEDINIMHHGACQY